VAYGLIGLYAVYFILVGVHGNASKLVTQVQSDGQNFLPWLLAILVLRALYSVDTLKPFVKPFMGLAALTFFLKNYGTIVSQLNQILPASSQLPGGNQLGSVSTSARMI
jgi:hypothetical protein